MITRRELLFSGVGTAGGALGGWSLARHTREPTQPALTVHSGLPLFVLAGQSNMSGYAPVKRSEPPDGVYVFGNDYRWQQAAEPIDSGANQVDLVSADIDPAAGFGPGVPFAVRMRELSGEDVGLIPCSKGGSLLSAWQRNTSDQTLYGSMLKRCHAASVTGIPRSLLFFQGESDAVQQPNAIRWAERFRQFVADVRRDLGIRAIVFAQIGKPFQKYEYWTTVQKQQASIELPDVAMIRTADLPLQADGLHFTAESYVKIGQRFADALASLISRLPSDNKT